MSTRKKQRRQKANRIWALAVPAALGLVAGGSLMWAVQRLHWAWRPTPAGRSDPIRSKPAEYSWAELPEASFPIPPYARFLSGVLIVLDPGHVGQRDPGGTWKRGPTGLREPDVNLRVALFLRDFLQAAGARATLTRETDDSLNLSDKEDLLQRVEVAERAQADLLLSIHHNGFDKPEPNYTLVFYHLGADNSLASLCAARHLLTGLNDALRLESHLECPVLTDQVLYKNGFAVLRDAHGPAVLTEASFHSNPVEEARLRDPVYNRREAYGLFLGLARWAQAGLPRVKLDRISERHSRAEQEAIINLDDGLSSRGGLGSDQSKILADSVVVKLSGVILRYTLDLRGKELRVELGGKMPEKGGRLYVDFENTLGQHVLHPWLDLGGG